MAAGDTPITVVGNLVADPELCDRGPGRREAQLGIVGQVADDRDGGISCHGYSSRTLIYDGDPATRV